MEIRPSVMAYAVAMEEKLRLNDHKNPWETVPLVSLFNRLLDEVKELSDAEGSDKALEAVDVGAFAMMIFSRFHPESRNYQRGRKKEWV